MYITDVRSPFSCKTWSPSFEPAWLAAFKDSTHVAVNESESIAEPNHLWTAVFLYIISQHIQALSTWEDRFGPNDMAWQQNNPKGTWGSFWELGPNCNMAQKNQTAPALNWLLFFHGPIHGHSIMRWRQTKNPLLSLLDPNTPRVPAARPAPAVRGLSYRRASTQRCKINIQLRVRGKGSLKKVIISSPGI